jgi:hypothetical protein
MKSLLILSAFVFSSFTLLSPSHNFKIESNNLIWQKVYDSEQSVFQLYESLRAHGNYEKIYIVREEVIFTFNFDSANELGAHGYKKSNYPSYLKPGGKYTGYLQKKNGRYRVTITGVNFNWNGDLVSNIDEAALKRGELRDNNRTKKVIQLFDRYFNNKFSLIKDARDSNW